MRNMDNPLIKNDNICYEIDKDDRITLVGESWDRFAGSNDGVGLEGTQIVGRSLWDFVSDEATRHLYRQIVARVRKGRLTRFTLRCDGPSCRRLLEMTISARADGAVAFETRSLLAESREPVPLLVGSAVRSTELLRMCAWCNRINVGTGPDVWLEVEEATERLLLFEGEVMPQLTHGICESCMESMTDNLAATDAGILPSAAAVPACW